jgi:hypothetical protein
MVWIQNFGNLTSELYRWNTPFVIAIQMVKVLLAQVIVFSAICMWFFFYHVNKIQCVWIMMCLPSFFPAGMDEEDDQSATLDQVLNDTTRLGYFKGYLNSVAQAIK